MHLPKHGTIFYMFNRKFMQSVLWGNWSIGLESVLVFYVIQNNAHDAD